MKALLIFIGLFSSVVLMPGPSGAIWELAKEKDGIKVFTRRSDFSKFDDIKIETDLVGNLSQVAKILLDVEKYPEWAYATKSATIVQRMSNCELIYYSEIKTPWPVSNRDFYAHTKITIDSAARSLTLMSEGMKDFRPEHKDLVRIPFSKGFWTISTTSNKSLHLEYELQINPGGSVPAWVINMFITKGPLETFSNLKQKMQLLNK